MPRKPTGKPPGRPRLDPADAGQLWSVRLTARRRAILETAAAARGCTPSALVQALIDSLGEGFIAPASQSSAPSRSSPAELADLVLEALRRSADVGGLGLATVGAVVLELEQFGHARDEVHAALLALDGSAVELRPSVGGNFTGPADEAAPPCRGGRLAYARILAAPAS